MEDKIIVEMTAVMREADIVFETVGGGTRHYVRDVLLPMMEKAGLKIIKDEQPRPGPVWVKASERLPGYETPVKWRDGKDHSHVTDGKIPLIHMAKPFLRGWEWLDESATSGERESENARYELSLALRNILRMIRHMPLKRDEQKRYEAAEAMLNKHFDIRDALRTGSAAAMREDDAVAFAEWLGWDWRRVEGKNLWENQYTLEIKKTAQLYELFKQKEK